MKRCVLYFLGLLLALFLALLAESNIRPDRPNREQVIAQQDIQHADRPDTLPANGERLPLTSPQTPKP